MSAFKTLYTELLELITELENQTDPVELDLEQGWLEGEVTDKEFFGDDHGLDQVYVEYGVGKNLGRLEHIQEILDKLKGMVG